MKKYGILLALAVPLSALAGVKFDFHVEDTIEQKILYLNKQQVLFEDERSIMTYTLTATLLEENDDYAVVNFNLVVKSTSGRSMTYDYPQERIKMNVIVHLKDLSYLYPLVFKATRV